VCIHPHPASFFGRDQLFPKLGFDEFIDVNDFQQPEKFGPYISDKTVTDKILEITKKKTDKPLFVFVITMENHGPLHLEKTSNEEQNKYFKDDYAEIISIELNDLTVYLRHLKNADKMIKDLTDEYKKSEIETTLCFYGDHVPSMPKVYKATNFKDEHSDYFIWNSKTYNNNLNSNQQNIISIDSLAFDTLKASTLSKSSLEKAINK
jgi:phosphoglycerol transferase MdoB-like AlkP superfamily enzyme